MHYVIQPLPEELFFSGGGHWLTPVHDYHASQVVCTRMAEQLTLTTQISVCDTVGTNPETVSECFKITLEAQNLEYYGLCLPDWNLF